MAVRVGSLLIQQQSFDNYMCSILCSSKHLLFLNGHDNDYTIRMLQPFSGHTTKNSQNSVMEKNLMDVYSGVGP